MKRSLFYTVICTILFFSPIAANPIIHVFGDSHSAAFQGIPNSNIHWLGPITMHRIGRDGLLAINLKSYPEVQDGDIVVFVFGEIDARCHIIKQMVLNNRDLHEVIENLCSNYMNTVIQNMMQYDNLLCIVYNVIPPANMAVDPGFPIYGSLEERVMVAKSLNQQLKSLCETFQIPFLHVYDDYADKDGVLQTNLSDRNVHIDPRYNQAIHQKIMEIRSEQKV